MSTGEWRYLHGRPVKHLLSGPFDRIAVCGVGPVWFAPDWYGTGSQGEYETAERLRKCKRCEAKSGGRF